MATPDRLSVGHHAARESPRLPPRRTVRAELVGSDGTQKPVRTGGRRPARRIDPCPRHRRPGDGHPNRRDGEGQTDRARRTGRPIPGRSDTAGRCRRDRREVRGAVPVCARSLPGVLRPGFGDQELPDGRPRESGLSSRPHRVPGRPSVTGTRAGAATVRPMRGQRFILDTVRGLFEWAIDPARGGLLPDGFRSPFRQSGEARTVFRGDPSAEPDVTLAMATDFVRACDEYELRLFVPLVLFGLRAAEPCFLFRERVQSDWLLVPNIPDWNTRPNVDATNGSLSPPLSTRSGTSFAGRHQSGCSPFVVRWRRVARSLRSSDCRSPS